MDISTTLSLLVVLLTGVLLGVAAGWLLARGRATGHEAAISQRALESRAADHAVVREGLERLHDQMRDLEQHRVSWQSQLKQQVDEVRHSTDSLRRETTSLATALRRPQVRGRWGELHLRRAVELAGLVAGRAAAGQQPARRDAEEHPGQQHHEQRERRRDVHAQQDDGPRRQSGSGEVRRARWFRDAHFVRSSTTDGQARSTITGAWSLAPWPARSSRSIPAPVTRAARAGEPSTKSMRMPRLRSKRCR